MLIETQHAITEQQCGVISFEQSVGYVVMKDKATGKVSDPLRMKGASIVGAFHGIITTKLAKTVHR